MTSSTAQVYDALILNHPKGVLFILFAILVFFGYHTKDFQLDASADSLLLEDDADLRLFRQIHGLPGGAIGLRDCAAAHSRFATE